MSLIAVSAVACELNEVVVPLGDPVILVHAVMRPDLPQQFIVVERSLTGLGDYEWPADATIPSEGSPADPIEGAVVEVRNLDFADDPCGQRVSFTSDPEDFRLPELAGVYWAPPLCPSMRAGDRLELSVEVPGWAAVVGGVTRVTAMDHATLLVAGESIPFGTDGVTTFNRDRDTLNVQVQPVAGRLLQLHVLRYGDVDRPFGQDVRPDTKLFADTMDVSLPGDLVDVFEHGDGDDVFRAGRNYVMSVAVTDTNYFDFARSRNNQYTGRGFINRITGGMGVFGSLVATSTNLKVMGDFDDPRDAVYVLTGEIQDVVIDATATAFTAQSMDDTEVSAFLDGDWLQLVDGAWQPWQVNDKSVDGHWEGNTLTLIVVELAYVSGSPHPTMKRLALRGVRNPDAPFDLVVLDSLGLGSIPLGTLTATRR